MSLAWCRCRKASGRSLQGAPLRLAAAASTSAALSARLELYPRGMSALSALRLSLGALAGADRLTEEELRARVRGRFPEAADLPSRPELDALLDEAGADREWPTARMAERYKSRTVADTGSEHLAVPRYPTTAPPPEATPAYWMPARSRKSWRTLPAPALSWR